MEITHPTDDVRLAIAAEVIDAAVTKLRALGVSDHNIRILLGVKMEQVERGK